MAEMCPLLLSSLAPCSLKVNGDAATNRSIFYEQSTCDNCLFFLYLLTLYLLTWVKWVPGPKHELGVSLIAVEEPTTQLIIVGENDQWRSKIPPGTCRWGWYKYMAVCWQWCQRWRRNFNQVISGLAGTPVNQRDTAYGSPVAKKDYDYAFLWQ